MPTITSKMIPRVAAGCCFIVLCLTISVGCSKKHILKEAPDYSSIPEPIKKVKADMVAREKETQVPAEDGSLWTDDSDLNSLFANQKARKIGDVVTIRIVESSKASNKASTGTDRSSSLSAGIDKFFGAENAYATADPFFNPFGGISGGFDRSFEGSGKTQRSGDLTAYLTARVVDVLPNGNLVLMGTREVGVNNEKQLITLSGIVRPKDISSDNQIQSIHISDAKISYSGSGVVNDPQQPGWLVRTLDAIWPF